MYLLPCYVITLLLYYYRLLLLFWLLLLLLLLLVLLLLDLGYSWTTFLGYWTHGQKSPVPIPNNFSSTFGNCPCQFIHNFSADARHGASPERDQTNRALPEGAARPQSGQTDPAPLRLTDGRPVCSRLGGLLRERPPRDHHIWILLGVKASPAWGQFSFV